MDLLRADQLVAEWAEEGGRALEAVVEAEDAEVGVQDLQSPAPDGHTMGRRVGPGTYIRNKRRRNILIIIPFIPIYAVSYTHLTLPTIYSV